MEAVTWSSVLAVCERRTLCHSINGVAVVSGVASCSALVFCAETRFLPPRFRSFAMSSFACPACSEPIQIDRNQVGTSVTCPKCGKSLSVKRGEDSADAVRRPSDQPMRLHRVHLRRHSRVDQWQEHAKTIASSAMALGRIAASSVKARLSSPVFTRTENDPSCPTAGRSASI